MVHEDTPKHSTWGASKFESIMLCPGKLAMEVGKADTTSEYAAEGTAAHQVLTWALQEGKPASAYVGREIDVDGYLFIVDDEMAEHVQHAMDFIHDVAGDDGVVMVDQRVNYAEQLGVAEDEGWGTLDVAVARGVELTVMDFKYGRGVLVEASTDEVPNPQLALYAVGALNALESMFGQFEQVTLAICQPRSRAAASTHGMTRDGVMDWVEVEGPRTVGQAKAALELANDGADIVSMLVPGEKQCKFCKAKASCPALRNVVAETTTGRSPATPEDFDDIPANVGDHIKVTDSDWLAASLGKVDMIEDWCKSIRAEAERRMLSGDTVPGYKLVQGKKGNRQWADPKAAEDLLKTFRLKVEEMYDLKLISPTSAEKLAKSKVIGPRQWPKAQELITQPDGKLHVAPLSDKREAVNVGPVADDFDDGPPA